MSSIRPGGGAYAFPWYGRRSALVLDENDQTRRYLREGLARAGYATEFCNDARALLESDGVEGRSFLILRSGDAGRELLKALRDQGRRIPVLFLSSETITPRDSAEDGSGIVAWLSAPFTLESLMGAIGELSHFDPKFPGRRLRGPAASSVRPSPSKFPEE